MNVCKECNEPMYVTPREERCSGCVNKYDASLARKVRRLRTLADGYRAMAECSVDVNTFRKFGATRERARIVAALRKCIITRGAVTPAHIDAIERGEL